MRLVDLLKYCGVHTYKQGARHVHFNGVDKELPQGDNGSYGTSLIYGTAMNPANDILVAYKHNGKLLAPDHGFPVRMIIPGGIGGRMVKWLAKIEVLPTESENFYHQHDNKVLPAGIEMDQANKEGMLWSLLPGTTCVLCRPTVRATARSLLLSDFQQMRGRCILQL